MAGRIRYVDASVDTKTDKLGRRTGPRRRYSVAEKLSILEETRRPGASIADVARAHGINHNVVFAWRRLAQRGLLRAESVESAPLLPVRVESPTLVPSAKPPSSRGEAAGSIEIEFPGGVRVRIHGQVDATALERVFKSLARR
jgi:transposase